MGWKQIGNHCYYYRSKREGGRVVSEYVGRGELAALTAQVEQIDRHNREEQRAEEQDEREADEREEREFAAWFDGIETLATGAMLAAGFHKHHGQWRRRRHGRDGHSDDGRHSSDLGGQAPGENELG
jgi:hypothetical protein